jgi:hypothetical protein
MTRKDIDVLFTNTVKEYMDKGLTIDPYSMRGCQTNEVGKVDLTDGSVVYRVLLEDGHIRDDKESFFSYIDYLKLSVRLYSGDDTKPHKPRTFSAWNNEGELLTERFFYQYENNSRDPSGERYMKKEDNPWYTEDLSAVQAANRKHWERRKARRFFTLDEYHDYPESAKTVLLPLVRRMPRCKTVHLKDIGRVYRNSRGSRSVVCVYVKGNCHDVYLGREESA